MIKDAKWFRYLMNNSTFKSRLKSRYQELRKGLLSNSNIDSIINSQANLIRTSANKNYQWLKYSRDFYYGDAGIQVYKGQVAINTFVWPNPQSVIAQNSFDKQVNWLKNWMHERLAWMDRNIPYM